jgi:dihydroorotate dehydrogenase (fumarate)
VLSVHVSFIAAQDGGKRFLGRCTVLIFATSVRPNARGLILLSAALAAGIALSASTYSSALAAAASDEDTIGISAEPLTDPNTTGRTRFSYQIGPGQEVDDAYVVSNTGSTPQTYAVFATDAFNTEDGGYGLLDTDVIPSDAGSWVTFEGGATKLDVILQPGESKVVPFTVRVPADAGPGDHAAGMLVSAVSVDGQVLVDRRVGTRLYVRVPGELQPTLTISSLSASYTPSLNPLAGDATVTFTVTNGGNVALAGDVTVAVKGLFGIDLAAPVNSQVEEMLPGSTRTVTTTVTGVGQWVFLNPSVTLVPTIEPDALNPGPLNRVNRDAVLFVVPWALLALVVIGLAIWGWIWFSRRRNDRRAQEWIEYTEAEARRKAGAEPAPATAAAAEPVSTSP